MPHIRPWSTVESALEDSDCGMRDVDNAAKHGVAVKTIRRWRREYQRRGRQRGQLATSARCPVCDDGALDRRAYAELLGWYLGDGHISRNRRDVFGLHVVNDSRHAHDVDRVAELLRLVKPGGSPSTRQAPGCTIVTLWWKHWPCLFPQHAPGRKHERAIVLDEWQREVVMTHPSRFLRGLFHSDCCRVRNWTTRAVAGRNKRHDYPRWQFSNRSTDIRELCCWALDLAEVQRRQSNRFVMSVSRREAVERLDALIGPKS